MFKECKVKHCRFKSTHTTSGHKCGTCGKYGHGQVECKNKFLKDKISQYLNDVLHESEWCTIDGCKYKWSHKTISHHCSKCNKNGHGSKNCPLNEIFYNIECPICRTKNKISSKQKKIYGLQEKCSICKDNEVNIFLPDCGHACLCSECLEELFKLNNDINLDITDESELNLNIIETAKNNFQNDDSKIYTIVYAGMGCNWFIRRDNLGANLEGIFMHSDSWGQYGENTSDVDKLNSFIQNYKKIN